MTNFRNLAIFVFLCCNIIAVSNAAVLFIRRHSTQRIPEVFDEVEVTEKVLKSIPENPTKVPKRKEKVRTETPISQKIEILLKRNQYGKGAICCESRGDLLQFCTYCRKTSMKGMGRRTDMKNHTVAKRSTIQLGTTLGIFGIRKSDFDQTKIGATETTKRLIIMKNEILPIIMATTVIEKVLVPANNTNSQVMATVNSEKTNIRTSEPTFPACIVNVNNATVTIPRDVIGDPKFPNGDSILNQVTANWASLVSTIDNNLANQETVDQVNRSDADSLLASTDISTAQTTVSSTTPLDVAKAVATVDHDNFNNSKSVVTNNSSSFVQRTIKASFSFPTTLAVNKSKAILSLFRETNSTSTKKNLSANITQTTVNASESYTTALAVNESETTVNFEGAFAAEAPTAESNLLINPIEELKLFTKDHDWLSKRNNETTALPLHKNVTKFERNDLIRSAKFRVKPRKLIDVCGNVTEIVRKLVRDATRRIGVKNSKNLRKQSTTLFSSTARISTTSIDFSFSKTVSSEFEKTVAAIQTVPPSIIVASRQLAKRSTGGKVVGFRKDGIVDFFL